MNRLRNRVHQADRLAKKSGQPCSSGELLADGDENEWRSDKPKNLSKNPGDLEGRCDRILREVRFNAKVFIREKSRSIESRVIWRTTSLLRLKVRDIPCCCQSDDPARRNNARPAMKTGSCVGNQK